ncbi:F-box/LRR-repeat protein 7-like [Uranotaenia lowii]|uniref:F-box/LRR-repeat protein 7-like n=1 Tax=Uranotaenia lowii TaxID=190385 RepID=UPI002479EA4A|nr:F-box/LRR-repeat protein 7-like [Uranotaenia lowii]
MSIERVFEPEIERTYHENPEDGFLYFFEPFFEELPFELMVYMMKFLNPTDVKMYARVCRSFYNGSRHPFFMRTMCIHFQEIEFEDNCDPLRSLLTAFRYFGVVKLTKITFRGRSDFWAEFGESIEELIIDNCVIWKQKLLAILRYTFRLKKLIIQNCPDLFKTWKRIENLTVTFTPSFPKLRHISLASNNLLDEHHFDYLVQMAPNLDSLDVSNCFKGIEAATRFKMLGRILKYVTDHRHAMKHLFLGDTPVDNLFLRQLADIQGLELKSLSLLVCDRIPNFDAGVIDLFQLQNQITYLDLSRSLALHDSALIQISKSMPLLETLILHRCWMITDYGILSVKQLNKLKHIDLTNCERITDIGIIGGLLTHNRQRLSKLYMGLLTNIGEVVFTKISFEFTDLTVLDLGGCSNCINDRSIQYIFYHMSGLKELNVDCCAKLSDAGMTGIDLPECAISIWDLRLSFSIENLKRLRYLNLSGCYRITNLTFMRKFRLMELKELVLARLLITEQGVESIVLNCPSLEILDLSECPNVNDQCVEVAAKCCIRLSTLKLHNCPQISNDAIDLLVKYCHVLKHLNIRGCYKLTAEAEAKLSAIRTLRTIVVNERDF